MDTEALYKAYRTPLFSLAYRMLGSVMDAEDIVQEAFIVYSQLPDFDRIQNVRAYLYKIVTNRCLDLLRSSERKRELYVGPWLPEPLIAHAALEGDLSDIYLQHESISTAYLLLLQQLNAVERAVFLLRKIFHYSYDEISKMVGKSSVNCRQIFSRAEKHSFQSRPKTVRLHRGRFRKLAPTGQQEQAAGAVKRKCRILLRWRRQSKSGANSGHRSKASSPIVPESD